MLNNFANYHEISWCHHERVSGVHRWPYRRVSETTDLVLSPLCTVSSGFQIAVYIAASTVSFRILFRDISRSIISNGIELQNAILAFSKNSQISEHFYRSTETIYYFAGKISKIFQLKKP
jgi:hypothetical protein